jgi:hypothetical protein
VFFKFQDGKLVMGSAANGSYFFNMASASGRKVYTDKLFGTFSDCADTHATFLDDCRQATSDAPTVDGCKIIRAGNSRNANELFLSEKFPSCASETTKARPFKRSQKYICARETA